MSLVTTQQMLHDARKRGYALAAFNVENMEMVQAVVEGAEELKSPVILQTSANTSKYAHFSYYFAMVQAAAERASVPVALHLDHGDSFDLAMQALRAGYTSIMIDGSKKEFDDNIAISAKVVEACAPSGIPVEAELGKVGGKEGDEETSEDGYTDPQEAKEFVEKTNVSSLAVAIGTLHGVYKGIPKLDVERLYEISRTIDVPLVLHGGSGLSEAAIQDCIKNGISKVNYATELRTAFSQGVKKVLAETPDVIDPKKYTIVGREYVKQMAIDKMKVCGSVGKA
ncbi:class II fructose-bisphosphate aldolase [Gracilibacillus sp. YIM 98692]|uniref:class II fructose-bisphosphate aldolase n=1 Tax=Gracilibacillus sp. YIM 98692 TaxID=2663532 RepID=UPI0013D5A876|nr:class II fructose-bisphosphate aldolase [Gracilibacillus sp. YIM 98692]